jgi:hypothetical protein
MRTPRIRLPFSYLALVAVLGLGAGMGVAGCSNGPAKAPASHPGSARSSVPTPNEPSTGPAAINAVKAMWQTFFNGTMPIPGRLMLLQNGQRFASFVHSEEKTSLGTLVLSASAKVSSVSLMPPSKASVTYTILLGGKPLAKNLSGTAVYAGGRWQVADATFCSLLHLAYGKSSHVIPAACGS